MVTIVPTTASSIVNGVCGCLVAGVCVVVVEAVEELCHCSLRLTASPRWECAGALDGVTGAIGDSNIEVRTGTFSKNRSALVKLVYCAAVVK